MATLREGIVNTINDLHPLLNANIPHSEKDQVREKIDALYKQLEAVIEQSINPQTDEFELAISALDSAIESAKSAKMDMQKTSETIQKTAKAISQIENVLKIGIALA